MVKRFKISQIINKFLFDEKEGYYKTKNPLGKAGDFVTSPEISQIFGEIIASYLLYIFSTKKTKFSLVEMGAGRGFLMRDILQTISNLAINNDKIALNFLQNAKFHIIEINSVLIDIQKQNLANFNQELSLNWHQNFDEFLRNKNGEIFFVSNELLDCFAIDQYVKTDIGWCERLVEICDDNFNDAKFVMANYDEEINNFVINDLGFEFSSRARIGSIFEYNFGARNFYYDLCQAINNSGGIAINCDYGYYDYDFANSLQVIKNHQKVSFLQNLKDSDITAHVDFFALDKITKNFNLQSSFITQRQFLLDLGAEERVKNLITKNPQQALKIEQDFQRLVAEEQMGDLFKFHIIWR